MDTILEANYTPIVVFDYKLNSFFVNLDMMLDLPTPESPTSTNFSWKSDSSFFLVVMNIKYSNIISQIDASESNGLFLRSFLEPVEKGESCSESSPIEDDPLLAQEKERANNSQSQPLPGITDRLQKKLVESVISI
jgi:hypothetical protein